MTMTMSTGILLLFIIFLLIRRVSSSNINRFLLSFFDNKDIPFLVLLVDGFTPPPLPPPLESLSHITLELVEELVDPLFNESALSLEYMESEPEFDASRSISLHHDVDDVYDGDDDDDHHY